MDIQTQVLPRAVVHRAPVARATAVWLRVPAARAEPDDRSLLAPLGLPRLAFQLWSAHSPPQLARKRASPSPPCAFPLTRRTTAPNVLLAVSPRSVQALPILPLHPHRSFLHRRPPSAQVARAEPRGAVRAQSRAALARVLARNDGASRRSSVWGDRGHVARKSAAESRGAGRGRREGRAEARLRGAEARLSGKLVWGSLLRFIERSAAR